MYLDEGIKKEAANVKKSKKLLFEGASWIFVIFCIFFITQSF